MDHLLRKNRRIKTATDRTELTGNYLHIQGYILRSFSSSSLSEQILELLWSFWSSRNGPAWPSPRGLNLASGPGGLL